MITAVAPGKIVLWGEYAVLAGAPSAVMALNTYAKVTAQPRQQDTWRFASLGFDTDPVYSPKDSLPSCPSGIFVEHILAHWGCTSLAECCAPLSLSTDSSAFFHGQQKLGLGSSAAVCTATYRLLCEMRGRPATLPEAMAIHRQWQGNKGSGLDVASAWHGGLIHFQNGSAVNCENRKSDELPGGLQWQVIFSGKSAATNNHIASFNAWQQSADKVPLHHLAHASSRLCEESPSLALIADYCDALKGLDDAAHLNIFTREHVRLGTLAAASGVLYKPCGAGGGDIGIGFSDDPKALALFRQQAAEDGFLPLDLEMASHGIALEHG